VAVHDAFDLVQTGGRFSESRALSPGWRRFVSAFDPSPLPGPLESPFSASISNPCGIVPRL
jgi:hypothetical protein